MDELIALALHKPVGVVTTMRDPLQRPTVADFIPEQFRGVTPVGRLDLDSSGLMLLTNDRVLGDAIVGRHAHVEKVYVVEVELHPEEERFDPLRRGISLNGVPCLPVGVRILARHPRSTTLEIRLMEGKHRQIRRSLREVKLRVWSLRRVAIGTLTLGDLPPREIRVLTPGELSKLRHSALSARDPRPAPS